MFTIEKKHKCNFIPSRVWIRFYIHVAIELSVKMTTGNCIGKYVFIWLSILSILSRKREREREF